MFFFVGGGIFAYGGPVCGLGCSHRLRPAAFAGTGARHAMVWLLGSGWMDVHGFENGYSLSHLCQMSQMYVFGYLHTFGRAALLGIMPARSLKQLNWLP